jgi:hypothetical protein
MRAVIFNYFLEMSIKTDFPASYTLRNTGGYRADAVVICCFFLGVK